MGVDWLPDLMPLKAEIVKIWSFRTPSILKWTWDFLKLIVFHFSISCLRESCVCIATISSKISNESVAFVLMF